MAELWTGALAAVGGAAAERGGGGGGPARRRGRATATNLLYRRRSPSSDGTDAPRAAADCVGHASVDAARRYACITCGAHLADHADLVSKAFQGRHGRAYLFANVYNCRAGEQQERVLMTGVHIVADIHCVACGTVVGWTYIRAHDDHQRYKEGKYILERGCLLKDNGWEALAPDDADEAAAASDARPA